MVLVAASCAWPAAGMAHGFGQRYDLPVPLDLFLLGAAAAVVLSFVILAVTPAHLALARYPRVDLLRVRPLAWLGHPLLIASIRVLAVLAFALIVAAGLLGNQDPFRNIAPTAVWVIWWVGIAYLSALAGDVWRLLNPWDAVYRGFTRFCRTPGRPGEDARWRYPEWLASWPAVLLLLAFAWCELVWPGGERPRNLAWLILAYSAITWLGMYRFGRAQWLARGEAFACAFGLLSRFAPTEHARIEGRDVLALRPWAVGLIPREPVRISVMVFVLVMLATVTFDGFLETPLWVSIAESMLASYPTRPLLEAARGMGVDVALALYTLAMAIFLGLFVTGYLLFSALTSTAIRLAGGNMHWVRAARLFVLSLVPIAIAYHLAHYLSFLMIAGQQIIPLLSDPFGADWNLFGTRLYLIDLSVIDARGVWYVSVVAIVLGHVIAVYLAHVIALREIRDHRIALWSQLPMLVLMVGYTVSSLWILAQPIVEPGLP